ncbi:universal stress protein [Denitrobaculum tricleocarpae]|uniref:Universal stress protein n=1 Tax=Denitrobaculum tricleocarpae TaxID=2591009 RepID=A0A545TXG0_9PROT|nr:universal stress protein [Denitrobaculum tricleocarpae]TQV81912.1 universal stress protein [Denitrobaculum tricleocarpae]
MFKDILLAVDLNNVESQEKALKAAVQQAESSGGTLHVMTVIPDFGMSMVGSFFPKDYEAKARETITEKLHAYVSEKVPKDLTVQHIVGHGTIYEEILRIAGECKADLIVMSSHRPELKDYLLGPNAARVVRHAKMSVMVVRGE